MNHHTETPISALTPNPAAMLAEFTTPTHAVHHVSTTLPPAHRPAPAFDLTPTSLEEAMRMADLMADSTFVPKDYQGRPGNVLVAIQWGMELGLKPLQAMQNIAVINGRPSLWGDAVLALVQSSPVCKDVVEYYEGEGEHRKAICIAKRHGREDKIGEFSVADARLAELLGKDIWKKYRDRMLKMRARAFALRDQFADVLRGMPIAEEQMDVPSDSGPQGHLDGGSAGPRLPSGTKGSQIAEAARPALTEDGAAEIVRLTRLAKTEGSTKFSAAWKALPDNIRGQIGKNKRDEMLKMGADYDTSQKAGIEGAAVTQ